MSFSNVGSDNPFQPGVNLSNPAYDPNANLDDFIGYGIQAFSQWPTANPAVGVSFTTDADNNLFLQTTGGGSGRPSSGLVYPRLT